MPGSYARLGVHDPAHPGPRLDLHAGTFDVDERAIGHGVRVLALTAVAMLARLAGKRQRTTSLTPGDHGLSCGWSGLAAHNSMIDESKCTKLHDQQ